MFPGDFVILPYVWFICKGNICATLYKKKLKFRQSYINFRQQIPRHVDIVSQ